MKLWPSTFEHCLCGVIGALFAVPFTAAIDVKTGINLSFLTDISILAVVYFAVMSAVRLAQAVDRVISSVLRFFGL